MPSDASLDIPAADKLTRMHSSTANPTPRFPTGGRVLAKSQPNELQFVTWNTGQSEKWSLDQISSHAEHQLCNWLEAQAASKKGFLGKTIIENPKKEWTLIDIWLEINLSPCTACATRLAGFLKNIAPPRNKVLKNIGTTPSGGRRLLAITEPEWRLAATISWNKRYDSPPQATNWSALRELVAAGWKLRAPLRDPSKALPPGWDAVPVEDLDSTN